MKIRTSQRMFQLGYTLFEIPERMCPGIVRYIEQGVIPGNFLQAIIKDSLKEAVMYADDENVANIPAYVNYFYNHAPSDCWGSEETMRAWHEKGGLEGGIISRHTIVLSFTGFLVWAAFKLITTFQQFVFNF
jgi:hypothetical protein